MGQEYKSGKIPQYKLDKCRESFLYWYPLDLRCSAKDLIKNHLTMALFNHAAIWDDEKFWPRSYYCNGYINVEGEKMSKSRGTGLNPLKYLELGMNPEWLRYYLAAKLNGRNEDIDFNAEDFMARVNSDLVGKYINIASRAANFISKYFDFELQLTVLL